MPAVFRADNFGRRTNKARSLPAIPRTLLYAGSMNFLGTRDPLDLVHSKQRLINLTRKGRESKSPFFRRLQPVCSENIAILGRKAVKTQANCIDCLTIYRSWRILPGESPQPRNLQPGFDLLMQVLGELFFWQPVDHLVEKTACDQTFGSKVIDTTALQIE